MSYFFVFQNKTYNEESTGGYLWAPKHGNNGRRISHWEKMRHVKEGDIIIHSYNKNIKAISVALSDCYSASRPEELADDWNNDGWRVDTEYHLFKNCLITSDYMEKLKELQPQLDAPFNSIGRGNTGYLFGSNKEMFEYIMQETYKIQVSKNEKEYVASLFNLDVKAQNKFNIPEIRIIPMSGPGEFPNKTSAEIQEEFFLMDLSQRDECAYYYRRNGLVSENNALLLFQFNSEIIASARLDRVEGVHEEKYKGAMYLYPDSIQVFKPFNNDELKIVCPDVGPFTQTKQRLSADNIVGLLELIEKNSQGYVLTDQAQQVTIKVAEKDAKKLDIGELLKRIKNNKIPKYKRKSEGTVYYRDPYIKELVKRFADGKCQLCGEPAPFEGKDGEPYLEEHHVVRLADGGEDAIENVTALCPNCHRRIHILNDKADQIILKCIAKSNKDSIIS